MIDRRRVLWLLRYGVGIAALTWLVVQADWAEVLVTLSGMAPAAVAIVLGASVLGTVAQFWTWHVLINRVRSTPFRVAAGVMLTVRFINHLTPSQAVGKSLAPAVLRQYTGYTWGTVVAVATLHTALFAVLYGIVALVGLGVFASALSPGLLVVIAASAGLYLVVGPLLFVAGTRLGGAATLAAAVRDRIPIERLPYAEALLAKAVGALPDIGEETAETLGRLRRDPVAIGGYAVGWAVALLVVPGVRVWVLLSAAGVEFSPLSLSVAGVELSVLLLPIALVTAYAVTLLPITPGGVGIAEASATLVLAALGVPATIAGPTILIDRFLGVYLPALVGWYPTMRLDPSWKSAES
ncbi:lysylphosphatidylglycerol synthase transmembrane domain-containing protein [Halapricum hydrolyticum]|uniref:Flippase-like domain-containing protein n=1 Tax=Halapricum hydrolyticum TaxID=2979991 RepID=A0AAE3ICJ3_9EURY|nr:lysylphosphatidylglycerol synthase transmembrane domain-containing protein [Halapricum hydrolyticum]MCU4717698.1 flippase-like domain-containing protein [Halapricum hydrolyticum]MCU4726773.1 flippase-like domain-containing protein [Halapricum hydrolyticum]